MNFDVLMPITDLKNKRISDRMGIEKLRISGFKGIDRLEFEPKMINVIVGKNNTGKTTLLEAADLLFNTEKIGKHYDKHLSKLINIDSEEAEILASYGGKEISLKLKRAEAQAIIKVFASAFRKDIAEELKAVRGGSKGLLLTEGMKSIWAYSNKMDDLLAKFITSDIISELSKESISVIKNGAEETHIGLGSEKARNILKSLAEAMSGHLHKQFNKKVGPALLFFMLRSVLEGLFAEKKTHEPVIFIKKLALSGKEKLENETEALKIHEIEKHLKERGILPNLERFGLDYIIVKNEKDISVPYDFMGDGFKAMAGFFWQLSGKDERLPDTCGKIMLIEEPENSMHPGYIRELVRFIISLSKEENIQFFLTSHSLDFIESFFDDGLSEKETKYLEKNFCILRMQKTQKQHILAECLNYKDAASIKNDLLIDLRGI